MCKARWLAAASALRNMASGKLQFNVHKANWMTLAPLIVQYSQMAMEWKHHILAVPSKTSGSQRHRSHHSTRGDSCARTLATKQNSWLKATSRKTIAPCACSNSRLRALFLATATMKKEEHCNA